MFFLKRMNINLDNSLSNLKTLFYISFWKWSSVIAPVRHLNRDRFRCATWFCGQVLIADVSKASIWLWQIRMSYREDLSVMFRNLATAWLLRDTLPRRLACELGFELLSVVSFLSPHARPQPSLLRKCNMYTSVASSFTSFSILVVSTLIFP